jgi:hypothetical protein
MVMSYQDDDSETRDPETEVDNGVTPEATVPVIVLAAFTALAVVGGVLAILDFLFL